MKNELLLLLCSVITLLIVFWQNPGSLSGQFAFAGSNLQVNPFQYLYQKAALVFDTAVDEVAQKLGKITADLDAKFKKAEEQAKNAADSAAEKVASDLKTEIKNAVKEYNELIAKQQKQLDDLEVKAGKLHQANKFKTNEENLREVLEKSEQLKAFKSGAARAANIELKGLDLHQKATMTTAVSTDNTNGPVIAVQRQPGIIFRPERPVHLRDVIATGPVSSPKLDYLQEKALTNGFAMVAEGAIKPQSDVTFEVKTAVAKKIATHLRVSEELLEDFPALSSYISNRFSPLLMNKEDEQILYGTGAGENLQGLSGVASAYTDGLAMSNVTRYDVLHHAVTQARIAYYQPNAIMIHPADYETITLQKDTQGRYLFPGGLTQINGVPLVVNTAVTAGQFFVGDFQLAIELLDRKAPSINFYNQDQDNAIRNLVTIVIEERIMLPIYRPDAFRYGTFANALATGSA